MIYDLVIANVRYVNLFTKEVYPAAIAVNGDRIAHVTQPGEAVPRGRKEYDGGGKYAVPGLIDTHVHIESSMLEPRGFAEAVLPHGTTTVLADPHEIGNVMGLDGIAYMLEQTAGLPLRVLLLAPSCVPSVPGLETGGACFDAFTIARMLDNDRVIGLGEVMDYQGVVNGEARMRQILEVSRKSGKFIQGHAPGLRGEALSRYLASGCESDHETHDPGEALEKLRAGMALECRYASNCRDLEALAPVIIAQGYPETVTFCTDDTEPSDLLERGHMDEVVRAAVRQGMESVEAVKIATVNAARLARLHDRGSLRPGNLADFLLVPDLARFEVEEVFSGGRLVARRGALIPGAMPPRRPSGARGTVRLGREISLDDFRFPSREEAVVLNTICYDREDCFVTQVQPRRFAVRDGFAELRARDGYAAFAVLERHGVNGNRSFAPVWGLGLARGAVATTVSHDAHNLFVAGVDPEDMRLAARAVSACGGGVACAEGGRIVCLLELPVAGLMSDRGLTEVAEKTALLRRTLEEFGMPGPSPYMMLTSFALAVIPRVRLTDCGLADTVRQKLLALECAPAKREEKEGDGICRK